MFGSVQKGANAYATLGVETSVGFASPHQLIVMLFDGALLSLATALIEMKAGNIAAKGRAISKAITIIEEGLRASLNKEAGGAIAQSLESLYEYMQSRLLQANVQNNPDFIGEVQQLLNDLRGAWVQINPQKPALATPPADIASRMMQANDKLAPQRIRSYSA